MRNRHSKPSNTPVAVGDGHFHKHNGRWVTHHAECAIKAREEKLNGDL